jgi:hypothetical protein
MQLERIRDVIRQQPFRAFRIAMANASSYLVKHPEFIAMPQTERKRSIVFYGEDGVHIIDLALIQELIVAEEPAASAAPKSSDESNGD